MALDAYPTSYLMCGSFSRVKWPGREADRSVPYGAEIKNEWSYTSAPQYDFMTSAGPDLPLT
jgi:hypothetical protein